MKIATAVEPVATASTISSANLPAVRTSGANLTTTFAVRLTPGEGAKAQDFRTFQAFECEPRCELRTRILGLTLGK
jgi:hypothetical protein